MTEDDTRENQPSSLTQWGEPPDKSRIKSVEFEDGTRLRIWADQGDPKRVVIQIDEVPRAHVLTTLDAEGPVGARLEFDVGPSLHLASTLESLHQDLGWVDTA